MFKFAALTALRQLRCGRRSIATPWGCELSNNRPLLLTLSNLERETRFVSGNRVVVTPWGCEPSNNYPLLLTRSDLERETRFELATPTLARLCSTTELFPHNDVVLCTYFMVTAQFLSYYKIHPVFCLLGQPLAVLNCSRQFSPA